MVQNPGEALPTVEPVVVSRVGDLPVVYSTTRRWRDRTMKEQYERERFESTIRELVKPLNNQYPRPWMTKLDDPRQADVFIVGKNQRKVYWADAVSLACHVDALFNRPPGGCRRLYDKLTSDSPSPARKNIDALVGRLEDVGVENVLETNVICYSTPMSNYLRHKSHDGGAKRGEEIFRFLLS